MQNIHISVASGDEPSDWPDGSNDGKPNNTLGNAKEAFKRSGVRTSWDEFTESEWYEAPFLGEGPQEASNAIDALLRHHFWAQYGTDFGKQNIADAGYFLCRQNPFHVILDKLRKIEHDGKKRLPWMFSRYFGAKDIPLNRAYALRFMMAAVRRLRQPGCKFDNVLVLQGDQGAGKTSALSILGGEWFGEGDLLRMNTQQIQEALERVWIWDLAELGGLQHAETEKSKAIISRQCDIGRGAYQRRVKRQRRHSVLTMTTNLDSYLQDSTGNRRFWIVRVGKINLKALRRDRDQLLAEAIALEATGKSLVLPKELWPDAAATQTQSMEDDPWLDVLSTLAGAVIRDEERISYAQIFKRLDIPRERQTRAVLRRVSECMRRLGWIRALKPFKLDGAVVRGFVRPAR